MGSAELWLSLLLLASVTPLMTPVEQVIAFGWIGICVTAGTYHLVRSWLGRD